MYARSPAVINVESVTPNRACNPDDAATCTLAPPLTLLHGGGGATTATGGSSAGVVGEEEDDDEEQLSKYKKAMMNR